MSQALVRGALPLPGGYRAEVDGDGALLTLRAPGGAVCVRITLAPEGPVVAVEGGELRLRAQGALRVDCQHLDLRAREGARITSGGPMAIAAGGELRLRSASLLSSRARAHHHLATRGDLRLEASDDVRLVGERIRLNSERLPGEGPPPVGLGPQRAGGAP